VAFVPGPKPNHTPTLLSFGREGWGRGGGGGALSGVPN